MFTKFFRRCTEEANPLPSSLQLKQALERFEEKENVLQKKISVEVERAKEFTKAKNRQAAAQCLKRKKFYEGQIEQLGSFQLRIQDQKEQKLPQSSARALRTGVKGKKECEKLLSKKQSLKAVA